jgi:putative membrane protein
MNRYLTLLLVTAATALAGCGKSADTATVDTSMEQNEAMTPPVNETAPKESQFLDDASMSDASENMLGGYIAAHGASDLARSYGATLARDHKAAREEIAALAAKEGVSISAMPKPEATAELAKLKTLSGPAFDKEVGRYMAENHTKDIASFEKAAKEAPTAAERALAEKTLPTLRKHLETAKILAAG